MFIMKTTVGYLNFPSTKTILPKIQYLNKNGLPCYLKSVLKGSSTPLNYSLTKQ